MRNEHAVRAADQVSEDDALLQEDEDDSKVEGYGGRKLVCGD